MKQKIKKFPFRIIIKIIIATCLILWFLSKSDVHGIFQSIINFSFLVFGLGFLLSILCLLVNAAKWKLLLPTYSIFLLLKLNFIGYYYSLILPGQIAGEVAKAFVLGKEKRNAAQIAASVLVDKITGVIALLLIGIAGLAFTSIHIPKVIIYGIVIASIIGILILFSVRWKPFYYRLLKLMNAFKTRFHSFKNVFKKINQLIYAWKGYSKRINVLMMSVFLGLI